MKKFIFLSLLASGFLQAENAPGCKKCQLIREYNAAHPENNYYWYDDYLEEKGLDKEGKKVEGQDPKKAETKNLLSGCKKCKDKDTITRPFDWNV